MGKYCLKFSFTFDLQVKRWIIYLPNVIVFGIKITDGPLNVLYLSPQVRWKIVKPSPIERSFFTVRHLPGWAAKAELFAFLGRNR